MWLCSTLILLFQSCLFMQYSALKALKVLDKCEWIIQQNNTAISLSSNKSPHKPKSFYCYLLNVQIGDPHFLFKARYLSLYEAISIFQTRSMVVRVNHRVVLGVLRDRFQRLVQLCSPFRLIVGLLTLRMHQISIHCALVVDYLFQMFLNEQKSTSVCVKTISS